MNEVKPNLLFISSHMPSLRVPQAGHKTAFVNLQAYAKDYSIYLVAFVNEKEEPYLDPQHLSFCQEVHLFDLNLFGRVVSILLHPFLPVKIGSRANKKVEGRVRELISRISFKMVHTEYTASAYYLRWVKPGTRTICSEHDVTYQVVERRKQSMGPLFRLLNAYEYGRQRRWELNFLSRVDEILVQSDKDKQILAHDGVDASKIRVIQPYVFMPAEPVRRNGVDPHSILFWGAMNRPENHNSIRWFIREIFPLVLQKQEKTNLYVVGANPPRAVRALKSKNITVTGFVESPLPYFERCTLAIAPLIQGAGVKVKVLECLNAGMPVVATSVGSEGISHPSLRVADQPQKFADEIIRIFENAQPVRKSRSDERNA